MIEAYDVDIFRITGKVIQFTLYEYVFMCFNINFVILIRIDSTDNVEKGKRGVLTEIGKMNKSKTVTVLNCMLKGL